MPVEAYFLLYWNMADYVASLLYSTLGRTKRETWRKKTWNGYYWSIAGLEICFLLKQLSWQLQVKL